MSDDNASSKPHSFNPSTVARPPPTYNQVAVTPILSTSKLVTVAGQTGVDPGTSRVTSGDIKDQARQAYQNVHNCLIAAGASPRDIIFVRHYIVKDTGDDRDVVDRGWGDPWIEYLDQQAGDHRPPDTVVGVASLAKAELLYEVEVWAVVNG